MTTRAQQRLIAAAHVVLILISSGQVVTSFPHCNGTAECEAAVGKGSECRGGTCSGPFEKGCLFHKMPRWKKLRVCNSEDPPEAEELGLCRAPAFDYMEIRIYSQDWEAVFFEAWILQILLSEMLGVPTTIETGTPDAKLNFYDGAGPFDYGKGNDWKVFETAAELGDCRLANRDPDNYQACAHVVPEVWDAQFKTLQGLKEKGIVNPPQALGVLGTTGLYIPKFVGTRDPSLGTYLGLQGEENRRKLADTFLRPTTWKDYCDQVSLDGCETDDGIARRPPQDGNEYARMFADGLYTGYFRKTEENDCDKNPNCTGHIATYPCGWTTNVEQQVYHLNIALKSSGNEGSVEGYTYPQLAEMWKAANATKSNLMMVWWSPELLMESFLGSDAEFLRITLPPPTQQCMDSRIYLASRCFGDLDERVGNAEGSCDYAPIFLRKYTSTSLSSSANTPGARRSPGFDAVKLYSLSGQQLGQLFEYWSQMIDPREAVCQWVVDNVDYMKDFVPPTYPRTEQVEGAEGPLLYSSIILAGIALVLILLTGWMVFRKRDHRAIKSAQIEFLWLLLAGLLAISIGAIIVAIPPTKGSCVAAVWLINLGYTFELVPLIVKVAAINRIMAGSQRMRRVVVKRSSLFRGVALISALMLVFLIVWTAVDPPVKHVAYGLTDTVTEDGDTIITVYSYCSADSSAWEFASVSWNMVLLLCTTVLAFQMRNVCKDFNESRTLAFMIYSHFVFVLLRVVTVFLSESVSRTVLAQSRSIIYSLDTVATILIYFVPKFMERNSLNEEQNETLSKDGQKASAELLEKISNLECQKKQLEEAREELQVALGAKSLLVEEKEANNMEQTEEIDSFAAQLSESNAKLQDKSSLLETLQSEHAIARAASEEIQQQLDEVCRAKRELEVKVETYKDETDILNDEIARKDALVDDLRDQVETITAQLNESNAKLQDKVSLLETLQSEHAIARAASEELQQQLDEVSRAKSRNRSPCVEEVGLK